MRAKVPSSPSCRHPRARANLRSNHWQVPASAQAAAEQCRASEDHFPLRCCTTVVGRLKRVVLWCTKGGLFFRKLSFGGWAQVSCHLHVRETEVCRGPPLPPGGGKRTLHVAYAIAPGPASRSGTARAPTRSRPCTWSSQGLWSSTVRTRQKAGFEALGLWRPQWCSGVEPTLQNPRLFLL